MLNSLGYDAGPVNGVMGNKTRDAIRAFEKDQGITIEETYSSQLTGPLQRAVEAREQAGAEAKAR